MTTLPPIPARMMKLARHQIMGMSAPVPWFVTWFKDGEPQGYGIGEPDFRVADSRKIPKAVKQKLCWVCGEKLGIHMAFVIGPMCSVNRVSSEPPCHHDCAMFSAQACPFLTRPRMRRNTKAMPEEHENPAGEMIERNPGVAAVWITRSYELFDAGNGKLFKLGEPTSVFWFTEGREARREEVLASIVSGYPILFEMAEQQGPEAIEQLNRQRDHALMNYVPA